LNEIHGNLEIRFASVPIASLDAAEER